MSSVGPSQGCLAAAYAAAAAA